MKPLALALPLLVGTCAAPAGGVPAAERPNIVVIMADDMGYSDPGCFGGEIRTPNLDALAAGGLRFTHFSNTSRCCPTRAALMTGLYPHQAGVGRMTFDARKPAYRGWLQPNTVTIAEVLRAAGYRTAMTGKWHLSLTRTADGHMKRLNNQEIARSFGDPGTYPVGRGFEEHYGVIWGVVNYFDPFSLVHDRTPVKDVGDGFYLTDAITDRAVGFIERFAGEPFFLYVAHTAPHWPLHALPEDIARYRDTYTAGWDAIREARYRRMVDLGLLDPDTAVLSERHRKEVRWEDNPTKRWDARAMAVHAAMVDRVDQGIGRIVAKLRERGILENTLLLFLSDNGASPEQPRKPGFDRPSETRDGRKMVYGKDPDHLPGPEHTFAGIGPMWANAANTPFRFWKKEQYEGGVATPFIAHWPAGIAKPGSITRQPGHVIDIMATCLDAAGAGYPETFEGRSITPLEGESLLPVFRGETRRGHDAVFYEHYGARAVRRGTWKLVARAKAPWELYDLAHDRTETRDLAAKHPDKVEELKALWQAWAERCRVLDRP